MPTDIDILRKIDRIHPYPAKFPVDLAMNYISKYTNIGNTVYDPFVGSGTTLLATRALERNAYGTDVNHIAVLISQFKLLSLVLFCRFKHLRAMMISIYHYFQNTIEKLQQLHG